VLDHLGLLVGDYAKSKRFFEAALAPLGYGLMMEFGGATAGFGCAGAPDFWISQGGPAASVHVAFRGESRERVRAFYEAAMAAGGGDNGAPGLRPQYHPNYYGAFVHDPDGNNIEAVCHDPE